VRPTTQRTTGRSNRSLGGPPEADGAPDRHAVIGRLKAETQFAADELIAPGEGLADIGESDRAYKVVRYGSGNRNGRPEADMRLRWMARCYGLYLFLRAHRGERAK
jgi:hypothetical protein